MTATAVEQPTLLLVDDEPNILSALRRVFMPKGFHVLTASSGAIGLEILARESVDLVISDMRMPVMDGAQFLREAHQIRPDIPRLLLTGHSELVTATSAVNEGRISRFLTKPWDNDELIQVVQETLAQQHTQQQISSLQSAILVADDDPMYLNWLKTILERAGFMVATARNGQLAIELLEQDKQRIDCVVLDRLMPVCGGLEALAKIRGNPQFDALPVIIHSSCSQEAQAEGKIAGAYSYLVKPCRPELLVSLVDTAVADYRRYRTSQQDLANSRQWMGWMDKGEFTVRSMAEADTLGTMLAHLCPDPERAFYGFAEILRNAVEHGNLGITHAEKALLNQSNTLVDEINRRQALPENVDKTVLVRFARSPTQIRVDIIDSGPGFDWRPYMEFSQERLLQNHGRGIAIARNLGFDSLEYRDPGNHVVATILLPGVSR